MPGESRPAPSRSARAHRFDLLLLGVAVCGVAVSAPLIAATAAPGLAVAFWRNAMAVGLLTPFVWLRGRRELLGMSRRELLLSALAGAVLAGHFALWVPSLSMTSVASSTALVTTTPIWTTVILRLRGERQPALVWVGSAVAFGGVLLASGVDLTLSARALLGDLMAVGGGMAAAAYVTIGSKVRRTVSTSAYTYVCYTTTALLLAACLAGGQSLGAGYTGATWAKLGVLTLASQLLGHSLLNRVVRGLGPSVTSSAILLETPGAALLAACWLGQRPPAGVYLALLLILAGLALVVREHRRAGGPAAAEVPAAETETAGTGG